MNKGVYKDTMHNINALLTPDIMRKIIKRYYPRCPANVLDEHSQNHAAFWRFMISHNYWYYDEYNVNHVEKLLKKLGEIFMNLGFPLPSRFQPLIQIVRLLITLLYEMGDMKTSEYEEYMNMYRVKEQQSRTSTTTSTISPNFNFKTLSNEKLFDVINQCNDELKTRLK